MSKGSRTNRAAGDSANRNSYEIELTGFLSNLNEDEEEGIVVRNRKTKLIVVEHSNSKQISLAVSNNPSNMNGRSENTVESWLAQVRSIFRRIGSGASVSPSE